LEASPVEIGIMIGFLSFQRRHNNPDGPESGRVAAIESGR
jgi:hypothetical protein